MFKAVACGRRGRSARRPNRRFYNPSISSRETAAVRNFAAGLDRFGSFSTEATAPGKRVDVGCWPDSSGPFHRRRFVGQCHERTKCTAANRSAYWVAFGASTILGSLIVKVDPWPGSLSTVMSPPIIRQNRLLIARPRPVPPYLRVVEVSAWENSGTACPSARPSCRCRYRQRRW
jgi:hypothetical protein